MDDETLQYLATLENGLSTTSNDFIVPPGERPCPICGKKMAVEVDQGISIDVCSEHGVWLDRNELAVIISKIRSGERINRATAIRKASKDGKMSGALFGVWSLLFD